MHRYYLGFSRDEIIRERMWRKRMKLLKSLSELDLILQNLPNGTTCPEKIRKISSSGSSLLLCRSVNHAILQTIFSTILQSWWKLWKLISEQKLPSRLVGDDFLRRSWDMVQKHAQVCIEIKHFYRGRRFADSRKHFSFPRPMTWSLQKGAYCSTLSLQRKRVDQQS